MITDDCLHNWFCREVLPLEAALTRFIQKNWRVASEVSDLRQEVYELALNGAMNGIPTHADRYIYTITRNHLINRTKRSKIVSFELVSDLEMVDYTIDIFATDSHLSARDELRRAERGIAALPPRCREVVRLRKIEGLSTREVANVLGVSLETVERQLTLGMRALVDYMLGGSGKIRRPKLNRISRANAK